MKLLYYMMANASKNLKPWFKKLSRQTWPKALSKHTFFFNDKSRKFIYTSSNGKKKNKLMKDK